MSTCQPSSLCARPDHANAALHPPCHPTTTTRTTLCTTAVLPNACLSPTARDVFNVLTARQEPGSLFRIRQQEIAERLGLTQSVVSRAIGQLRDKGISASGSARAPCSSTRCWPATSR
ncbi:helix-turn-helix domain-containing protein [Streptomyces werraensis]|uniref:helix-turn-helix domain-containing protein n=1 Tax=Streptomyces werraensis TaxID=68284 RepID=UPI0036BB40CC